MPLQKISAKDQCFDVVDVIGYFNKLTDYINALEARLSALEHPVESLSEEGWEKVDYKQVFKEDKDGDLTLVNDLIIKGQLYKQGTVIRQGEKLGGYTWSVMKYLSLSCKTREDVTKEVVGFLSNED